MDSVQAVAAVASPPSADAIKKLPKAVSWLQIRADLTGDVPAAWLRNHFPGNLFYSLRRRICGGTFDGSWDERRSRLMAASSSYDLIELEAESDLSPEMLECIPPEQRLIFQRTPACSASQLGACFVQMASTPARFYYLASVSSKTSDGLQPLLFLKELGRRDVVALSEGSCGLWSRLLTPYFGAPFLFGRLEASREADDLTVEQLVSDYGFPALRPLEKLYGIAGNPVWQSLSPRLHNAGYRAINYPALFVPFHVECFEDFRREMLEGPSLPSLGIPIRGVTIVSPYKEVAAAAAAEQSTSMVRKAASTNIFVRKNGSWKADTTDPESVAVINGNRKRAKAAVIGCGGAGRAVAAALRDAGAEVTLVNRSMDRGNRAGTLLGLPFIALSQFQAQGFTLLVNATPIGRQNDGPPFAIESLNSDAVIIDLAYGANPTPLVSGILARGGTVVDGYDVLLSQVRKQFRLMVGREMPHVIGRELALRGLANVNMKGVRMEAVAST